MARRAYGSSGGPSRPEALRAYGSPGGPSRPEALSAAYGRARPAGGRELRAWLFMRLSGLVLLFLALGHLVLMHLINNVDDIDYQFVAARYVGWFWRGYDLLMLWLAMLHGISGMRIIIDDYLHAPGWRGVACGALYLICGGLLLLGTYVAVFFVPLKG